MFHDNYDCELTAGDVAEDLPLVAEAEAYFEKDGWCLVSARISDTYLEDWEKSWGHKVRTDDLSWFVDGNPVTRNQLLEALGNEWFSLEDTLVGKLNPGRYTWALYN